ncbi:MAG: PQQ-dependent sugar dehydrogenase, partial [Mycobacterium sp.]|nr:PQQ-dependent sugar dehydrogenase [Mycobacterium sp.]
MNPLRGVARLRVFLVALIVPLAMLPPVASAQGGSDVPAPPSPDRFQKVLLEGGDLTQPMRIAVAPDGRVIYIERDGRVKVWDPKTQDSIVAGTVPVRVVGELGLVGLALAPDFETTGHIYLHFSRPDWDTSFMARVSRFTLSPDNVLDLKSETPIIDIQHPKGVGGGHSAGDLLMTEHGQLFISTGDNTDCCASRGFPGTDERPGHATGDAQRTAANTNDLNGKVLRIVPKKDGGYTIPPGNLFPENKDVNDKTRPEIYAMGLRNPFTLGDYDEKTGALWMADYGPDAIQADPQRGPAGHVRVFLMTGPGNYGWPYCTMNNVPYNDWNYVDDKPGPWFDCAHPVNDSPNNTGLVNLPPIKPATIYYTYEKGEPSFPQLFGGGAMAGPMYHFDKTNPSKTKFPEWFDGRRFFYDWTTNWVQTTNFDKTLTVPQDMSEFLPDLDFSKPMDMAFGPDGSLYVLEYGNGWGSSNDDAGLYRIDYVEGNRVPLVKAKASADSGPLPLTVDFDASASTDPDGDPLTYSWDFDGDGTADATGAKASHTYTTAGDFRPRVTVTDAGGQSAIANLSVVAGNTRPIVTFESPIDGTFAEFGQTIPFKVKVTDPDGGPVDCTKVKVNYLLGHNQHAHPMSEATPDANCEGTVVPGSDASHGSGAYVFHIIQATYTDEGNGNAPPLTGESDVVLHPSQYNASTYQA